MFKKISLWLSFLFITHFLIGQVYNFQYLNNQNGLPQSQAYAICFDSQEMAWIGTQGGGIAIYDGNKIRYLTKQDSLISNRIYCIKQFENQIYIGCKGGVSVADETKKIVNNYHLKSPAAIVQDILFHDGKVWLATTEGLFIIRNESLEQDAQFTRENILSFFLEEGGKVWLCTTNGIIQYSNPINKINKSRGLRTNYVTKTIEYNSGWLIGTYGSGLKFYDKKNKVETPKIFSSLNDMIILDLLITDYELWIATMNNGIYVYNFELKTLSNFTVKNGLSNDHVKSIVLDEWGNKWIGTSGGGVSIFNNSPFLKYDKSNGLNSNYIYSVLTDSDQNLWVGTQGLGVIRINDTATILFDEEYGFESVKTKVIYEDSQKNIWFGTEGSGIGIVPSNYGKDTVFQFRSGFGLTNNWIRSLVEDPRRQVMYIGTAEGLYQTKFKLNKGEAIRFKRVYSKLLTGRINDLAWNEKSKRLYFASDDGLGYIENKTVTFFEQGTTFRNVIALDYIVWGGSTDNGVLGIRLDQDSLVKTWFGQSEGLLSNNIYQITDDFPFLWVGTEKGLTKFNVVTYSCDNYGYEEGFEGVETNVNASFIDDEGNLWFGTTDGLFSYNKKNVPDSSQNKPPVFYLDDVQIFYQSILETEYQAAFLNNSKILLPHSSNHIGFKMSALHYTYQNKIRYKWKLLGTEEDWGPAIENNMATYSNLNPGKYTFLVKASIDDNWDIPPVSFSFEIEAPYWERLWFKALYISASVILVLGVLFFIYRRNKQRNAAIIEKIEVEKSILELEQKALRLQMNPHFIFNVLNSIHNLIILNDSGKARYALAKFSKLMRQVLENSREKLISIDDEVETIQNYIQLEKLTTNTTFELEIEIADTIDTNEAILPPLMIQPFIENAVIHGFKGIDYQGRIHLRFYLEGEEQLVCEIEDNGIGRIKAKSQLAQKENYHKSTALQVTQERLANLNSNHSKSAFEIIDLTNELNQSSGTKVVIRVDI